jgi:hypothetical protein
MKFCSLQLQNFKGEGRRYLLKSRLRDFWNPRGALAVNGHALAAREPLRFSFLFFNPFNVFHFSIDCHL